MPVSFFEGVRADEMEAMNERNMERRFYALASAIREHESRTRAAAIEAPPEDERLYRKLRQLCGEPVTSDHEVA